MKKKVKNERLTTIKKWLYVGIIVVLIVEGISTENEIVKALLIIAMLLAFIAHNMEGCHECRT